MEAMTDARDIVERHPTQIKGNCPTCGKPEATDLTSLRKQLEEARDNALEEAAEVVEASRVQEHIAVLAPEIAKIINNGFGEVAQLIRKLKGMTNG